MNCNKHLIALALASALGACSDSSDAIPKSIIIPEPVVIIETTINGKGIKGVLTNAVVTVYKFVDGSPIALSETELKEANISTDGEGNYTFTVLDYDGPIKIELSPSTDPANPTTMTCDAPAGCGDTAFGKEIDLTAVDPDFKLSAISIVDSNSDGKVKVNISALTHLASVLIEASDDGVTAETVTEKSALIASTFGIDGDITQLEPTVTDDASAVAAEDNAAELRYGLINAGIMAALFSGETDDSGVLSSKLAQVAADLIANDGAFLVIQDEDDGFELALSDVLAGASDAAKLAADTIAADDTLTTTLNLVQLETQLVNEQAYQEANVGEDGFATVVIDVPTEGDAVAKAKAMVSDIRLFSHLFNDETSEGAGIKTQGDEYVALLNNAGIMIQAEIENFELLAQISNALADLSLQYDAGTLSPTSAAAGVSIASYLTTAGAVGTITFDERTATNGILFKVNAVAGNEKATLTASAEFSDDKKSITLTIEGLLESAGAVFTLHEGSFARVNLDTTTSRDALENDTYEGKIISGELELTLSLAQKATDLVPNPVTFEGMVKTKLLLVEERVLNERWDWDNQNQQDIISYGRPELETFVLPEMLTLSGAFSSLKGDLISATLTVNINGLDTYKAPEFKYIGKEVADVVSITFSADLNTIVITEADKVSDEQQTVETRVFTSGQTVGEWSATSSVVTANPEKHYWGTGIERKIITKRFDSGIEEQGILYTRAYITGEEESSYGVKSVRITPVDHDGNGTTDAYYFEAISNFWDDKEYDGTSFATLMDANGNILTSDGNPHNWDTVWSLDEFDSIEAFMKNNSYQLIANPLTVTNGAELLSQTITNWWQDQRSLTIDELGQVTFFFNEDELTDIAAGEFTELNPISYLTQPLIKDALTIAVSADTNTVTTSFDDASTKTFTFTGGKGSDFNFNSDNDNGNNRSIWSKVTPIDGLDVPQVIISHMIQFPWNELSIQLKFMPVDDQQANGEAGPDGIADRIEVYYIGGWGNTFNDDGVLIDGNGDINAFNDQSWPITQFDTVPNDAYANFFWTEASWGHIGWNPLPFNPLTVASALDVYKALIMNDWDNSISDYIDDIGKVEVNFDEDKLDLLVADSTTMFDGYNTEADSDNVFEDEDTFLNVNAALTLEAILGDYEVKIQLSGERTALEAGIFDLAMSYRLPGENAQRSFTVHYNTEEEGRLTANNFEGVVLVLNEPDEDATGIQILGHILVGPTAIVAATIEDRDGIIMIVYADTDGDGIHEEETL
ncbi:hypothetical protein CMT41_02890 [Colwellia sp. MT41]|uniref:Uncharacterized protein n=1 Tax=Colwellia marinimaniae TaxID=1513592 RepID=A0ABQ0MWN6_9GAMM|nr:MULTISPECIES: hypothetical protein [Colwellia]ALO33779.1 hypothetical protein CMT41_02890 [Colwellia sp. MT41]GAW96652.1 hypothetical protein MTCD1_02271 [Colwellia marinimaniae]